MKICTQQDNTGFAPPSERWAAIDDDTYDWTSPIGRGATEEEAIADLKEQIDAIQESIAKAEAAE